MQPSRREALLREYGETNSNFRLLTDIRFKLLALLPISAAAAAAFKGDGFGAAGFVVSLFGLVVTLAVAAYNARNDQLYDELVGRAASIERSLGLPDGGFANRPRAWLRYSGLSYGWKVEHRDAVAAVYCATCALWLTGVLTPIFELSRATYVLLGLPHFTMEHPEFVTVVVAAIISISAVLSVLSQLRDQRAAQELDLRATAHSAVALAVGRSMQEIATDESLLGLCRKLAGTNLKVVTHRAYFYSSLEPESLAHFVLRGSSEMVAAQVVGLLTDLPARWLFDCATNRRGLLDLDAPSTVMARTE